MLGNLGLPTGVVDMLEDATLPPVVVIIIVKLGDLDLLPMGVDKIRIPAVMNRCPRQ